MCSLKSSNLYGLEHNYRQLSITAREFIMGKWEEQVKRTTQRKKLWSESQKFSFTNSLIHATNEEEVKAAYVREFLLPVNTQERHDLLVDNILFEFKYSVKFYNIGVASKVIAQVIYYANRLFKQGRIDEIKYIVVADKDEARLFRLSNFKVFYESNRYRWNDFRPSSPDPKLIKAIKDSKIIESNRVYKLTSEEDLKIFSSLIYQILSNSHSSCKSKKQPEFNISDSLQFKGWLVAIGLFFALISIGVLVTYHYVYENDNQESLSVTDNS